jgi:hypothetical protein
MRRQRSDQRGLCAIFAPTGKIDHRDSLRVIGCQLVNSSTPMMLGSVVTMARCGGSPRRAMHALPKAGKGQRPPVLGCEGMGLLAPVGMLLPFVPSVHRHQAAPLAKGSPEHGRRADGVGPRVDRPESAGGILGPVRSSPQRRTSKRRSPVCGWRRSTGAGPAVAICQEGAKFGSGVSSVRRNCRASSRGERPR